MPSIFEYAIAYVESLSAFDSLRDTARAAGVKGLAIKLYDANGNPLADQNRALLASTGYAANLRTQGFTLGAWSCPRFSPEAAAGATSDIYAQLGLSFCVFETEKEYEAVSAGGGGVDVARLLTAWRAKRPKAWTGFAVEGGPPDTFNHAAVIADPFAVLCPENYWQKGEQYDVRPCLAKAAALGWSLSRVKPTLTGVEGAGMAESIIRAERAPYGRASYGEQGVLLWRGDMLSQGQYAYIGLADNLALR